MSTEASRSLWGVLLGWLLDNRLIVALLSLLLVVAGLSAHPFDSIAESIQEVMPFDVPRDRVAVDAIPDIGENQQIVFTTWPGRSPRDIEDQVTYPLTTQLLGLPGVKTVRSSSMFGFSSIYVIFEDDIEFYWARSRILEKLNALPDEILPSDATPVLGPDATALGQVYWYTLEGRDPRTGEVLGGWDLHELRTIQDWTVRYGLQATPGVSEVSSVGGHVLEYQVEVDPRKLEAYGVSLTQVARALREANRDVGARTVEINRVEYIVRGVGQVEDLEDIAQAVVLERDGKPLLIEDLARVGAGPAARRGVLDVGGAEAVGGVVVARYGENPVEVIEALESQIAQIQPGLPSRTMPDGRISQVTIVPFYDRSKVVEQTLGTLSEALIQQILITIIVVMVLLGHLRSSILISVMLPLTVLGTFVLMRLFGVTANVMSLAGIAIAIGTMVDMGIVMVENMVAHHAHASTSTTRLQALRDASAEVAPAITTSVLTTVLSFLPVFGLTAAEGKLFYPLAIAKTFALLVALTLSLCVLPTLAAWLLTPPVKAAETSATWRQRLLTTLRDSTNIRDFALGGMGIAVMLAGAPFIGIVVLILGIAQPLARTLPAPWHRLPEWGLGVGAVAGVLWLLNEAWLPLGPGEAWAANMACVAGVSLGLLALFWLFLKLYEPLLSRILAHKTLFLMLPLSMILTGVTIWLGVERTWGWLPEPIITSPTAVRLNETFPGLGEEFMPPFDEGQFLYMPSVMPHASLGQASEQLRLMDAAIMQIPEVEVAVGKLGRVDSALDPAPVSMFETVVTYKPEYTMDAQGNRIRQWRDHIQSTEDIWQEIVRATEQPGLTSAPKLMPIQTRIIMLQSGMRAPMGIKVQGPDLESLALAGKSMEEALARIPALRKETIFAEKVVGKPYLEIDIDRAAISRLGLSIDDVQQALTLALSGTSLSQIVDGRERIALRLRYVRDARQDVSALERLLVTSPRGEGIPLGQLAKIKFVKGPQVIKSEDTFLTSYVIFDRMAETPEVEVIEQVREMLAADISAGKLTLPEGVSYSFAGSYQNQVRSAQRLSLLVPLALLLIFIVLYVQFRKATTALMIYTGVGVALSGAFMLCWCYQQPWFLDAELAGHQLRQVFQIAPFNLSVAVWVGMIALIGIATDDGVVMATYIDQQLDEKKPDSVEKVREAILHAGKRRVRPCLMTTATTMLALLPVITSSGRGADVMIPMAIPSIGGMGVELITLFVVPVLYASRQEVILWWKARRAT